MRYLNGWTKATVTQHLKDNFKGKSEAVTNECKYRLGEKKCVAGCFIPDDMYHANFEGRAIDEVMDDNNLHQEMPFSNDLMEEWQRIHDKLDTHLTNDKQLEILTDFLL